MSDGGPRPSVELAGGEIRYRESGTGPPLVFVHGLLVNGLLWRKVTPRLEGSFRCLAPDWPLGSHPVAMRPDADLSPPGLTKLISDFLAALDLDDVTLVANDTGGALAQLVIAEHPDRIGRLVLTNCDAYENFLPLFFRPLQGLARLPGALTAVMQGLRVPAIRRGPLGFGLLTKRPIEADVLAEWARPFLTDGAVRRDTGKVLRGISKRHTLGAAERFGEFRRPVLLAWGTEDRFFRISFAERLSAAFPDARLEPIEDSRAFVPEDRPERLAELISELQG